MKEKFYVTGMTCAACSAHVERAVSGLDGVQSVRVNLLSNSMTVDYDPAVVQSRAVIEAVVRAGYGARTAQAAQEAGPRQERPQEDGELAGMRSRLLRSLVFLLPLLYVTMGHMLGAPLPAFLHGTEHAVAYAFTQLLLTLPVLYINDRYYKVGFRRLLDRAPNMDSLVAVSSTAAVVYGVFAIYRMADGLSRGDLAVVEQWRGDLYFESAAMILTLITLGKYLEARMKGKTSRAITRLMDLAPKTACVLRDGQEVHIPVEEVRVGDRVVVRPGQAVPVDGVIVEGSSAVDEAALTGESIPVDKTVGDRVSAAGINRSGAFVFEARKVGEDTTLSQMIRLVEEASASKVPIARLADRVAGVFVPVVMAISVVTAAVWLILTGGEVSFALTASIAVLVISCPCALALATPMAVMVAAGKGAENGILIRSGQALELLHRVDTVVLDKTGTLTQGRPEVTDILPAPGVSEAELMGLAAGLEQGSEHPLARAVVEKAAQMNVLPVEVNSFTAIHGKGVTAELDGGPCLGGNRALLEQAGVDLAGVDGQMRALSDQGKTPMLFARQGRLLGLVAVADAPKPTSRRAVEALRQLGLEVIMLTGDNERTARAMARQLGMEQVIAQVLPDQKQNVIAQLQQQGKRVAMVGDGINDAPALARAEVGIAIGAGTDIAIDSADIVLMKSDLMDAVTAVELSRSTIANIRLNLFWAFFYNCLGIPLAAGVFYPVLGWQLDPMFGAAAMSLSSVCVTSNTLRLRKFKSKFSACGCADHHHTQHKEEKTMKKTMIIEGMMCTHCTGRVEQTLAALEGVSGVEMSLEGKSATLTLSAPVDDRVLIDAVTQAGYQVVSVQ